MGRDFFALRKQRRMPQGKALHEFFATAQRAREHSFGFEILHTLIVAEPPAGYAKCFIAIVAT